MTKEELLEEVQELYERIEDLEDELSRMDEAYYDLENTLAEYENEKNSGKEIYDYSNLLYQLKINNLYTKELEEFLDYYMRYHNMDDLK